MPYSKKALFSNWCLNCKKKKKTQPIAQKWDLNWGGSGSDHKHPCLWSKQEPRLPEQPGVVTTALSTTVMRAQVAPDRPSSKLLPPAFTRQPTSPQPLWECEVQASVWHTALEEGEKTKGHMLYLSIEFGSCFLLHPGAIPCLPLSCMDSAIPAATGVDGAHYALADVAMLKWKQWA